MEILRIVVHPQKNFSQKENTVKKKSRYFQSERNVLHAIPLPVRIRTSASNKKRFGKPEDVLSNKFIFSDDQFLKY